MKYNFEDEFVELRIDDQKPTDRELQEIEDEYGELLAQDHFEMIQRRTGWFDDAD